ncbi:response regulator [Dehalobacter sp. TBBPA1]|uniref:response regulator n=1 Tax=Dehalobacter sp. TBBPA1 TaxID=3235037 RepID=UPI0034A53864
MNVKVLIVDSHGPFAENTKFLFSMEPQIEIAGIVKNGEECLDFMRHSSPDVILLDIHLDDSNGISLIEQIKRIAPTVKIIMLTEFNQEGYVIAAKSKGAQGVILKDMYIREMVQAILRVIDGGSYFYQSPLAFPKKQIDIDDMHFPVKPVEILEKILTPEEKEIMRLLTKRLSNKKIASILGVSARVLSERINIILLKFGVNTKLEAVLTWPFVEP